MDDYLFKKPFCYTKTGSVGDGGIISNDCNVRCEISANLLAKCLFCAGCLGNSYEYKNGKNCVQAQFTRWSVKLTPTNKLRDIRNDLKPIAFVVHHLTPERLGLGFEQVIGMHVCRYPRADFHFFFQLCCKWAS